MPGRAWRMASWSSIVYGQRMKGEWTLVKTRSRDKRDNSWLLIKHHDGEERPGDNGALVNDNQTSVLSGRTMDEIAADGNKAWKSNRVATGRRGKPNVLRAKSVPSRLRALALRARRRKCRDLRRRNLPLSAPLRRRVLNGCMKSNSTATVWFPISTMAMSRSTAVTAMTGRINSESSQTAWRLFPWIVP